MKNKISILEIKKYLKKKGLVISKRQNERDNFYSLSRTFLASLVIILVFFISPMVIDFTNKSIMSSKNFENNSRYQYR